MSKVVIENISKVYSGAAEVKCLEDISLTISNGEFLCILGPSGCGKSTLLEIIAELQEATSGEINFYQGQSKQSNVNMGFVFQDPSLFPWRTVNENVELGLESKE